MNLPGLLNKLDSLMFLDVDKEIYQPWVEQFYTAFFGSLFIVFVIVGLTQLLCYFLRKQKDAI